MPTEEALPSKAAPAECLSPASLPRRLGALIYDGLLVLALAFASTGILTLINDNKAVEGAWYQSLLFVETYVFCAWFWLRNRATLGMQAWRLQVQTSSGEKISIQQSLIRYLLSFGSLLPLGLGYLWILVDPARRSWSDIGSGTQIVYVPKPPPKS